MTTMAAASRRDAANNLIQDYAWDQKRRIESVQQGSGAVDMVYDTSDYRVGKATGSSPEDATVYYREAEHLEAAYDGNDTLKEKYLRGAVVDELINGYSYDENGQGTSATYHHDHLRSVVAETGHDGSVLSTIQYDPFGNVLNETGTPQSDLRYTGRMYDPETGLYYYRARYYDAEVGRFISEDPIGFEAGINFYAYVSNNPIRLSDPTGFCPQCRGAAWQHVYGEVNTWVEAAASLPSATVTATLNALPQVTFYTGGNVTGAIGDPQSLGMYGLGGYFSIGGGQASVGTYELSGPSGGLDVDASLNWGFVFGSIDGTSASFGRDWGPGSVNVITSENLVPVGAEFGMGPGAGWSTSQTTTEITSEYSFIDTGYSDSSVSASGGFVIYPSRPNLNSSRMAYSK